MNDTVREELQSKITSGSTIFAQSRSIRPPAAAPAVRPPLAAAPKRIHTNGLAAQKTSPTLIEFQNKNKTVPDWRLQLQNAVQQRKGGQNTAIERQPLAATEPRREGQIAARAAVAESPQEVADPRVVNAMRRIAESRKAFTEPESPPRKDLGIRPEKRPFGVVPASNGTSVAVERPSMPALVKPTLVNVPAPQAFKRDTNKLPRIEIAAPSTENDEKDSVSDVQPAEPVGEFAEIKRIRITVEKNEAHEPEWPAEETDEIEDLAPFSMRFGAGLFDVMIGVFASMLLLSPLVFAGLEWMTWGGFLTLTGTAILVLFLYMTASLGFFGKTAGMKLFSLELVDAKDNEYPTLRQSAVNSSLFLLSLAFAGAGFLTMLFNEEKRAIHDLLSGTILVREF